MMYLDANVFVNALADGVVADACTRLFRAVAAGTLAVATSILTLDETLWSLRRRIPYPEAIGLTVNFLDMPVAYLQADAVIFRLALADAHTYGLKPRDAIHLASMQQHGITTLCSTDSDFDRVKGLKRVLPQDVVLE